MASCKPPTVFCQRERIGDELASDADMRRCHIAAGTSDRLLDVEGDVLRLAEELLGALDVLLKLLERRVRQARQIRAWLMSSAPRSEASGSGC
jgi:hypothetical protein